MRIRIPAINQTIKFMEFFALLVGIPAALMFMFDLKDRIREREAQSWELLAIERSGASGKSKALEYLNSKSAWYQFPKKQQTSLSGIDISTEAWPGAYLRGLDLFKADLSFSNFTNSRLIKSSINQSDLDYSIFNSVEFNEVRLGNLDIFGASLAKSLFIAPNISSSIIESSCLMQVQFPSRFVQTNSPNNYELTDVVISRVSLKGADLSMLTGNGVWILDSDMSGVVVDDNSPFNAMLDVKNEDLEKVVNLYRRHGHVNRRGKEFSESDVFFENSRSWYLYGNEPVGIDLDLLEGLTVDEYVNKYREIKLDVPCLDQEFRDTLGLDENYHQPPEKDN